MAKKYYGGESGEPRRRVKYMMLGNAVLAGSAEPAVAPPERRRLKAMPKGSNLVGNLGSLFDIGETAVKTGVGLIGNPRESGRLIERGLRKDYDRARVEAKQGVLAPLYYGKKESRQEEARELRRSHLREAKENPREDRPVNSEMRKNKEYTKEHPYRPQIIKKMSYNPTGRKTNQGIKTYFEQSGHMVPRRPEEYEYGEPQKYYNEPEDIYSDNIILRQEAFDRAGKKVKRGIGKTNYILTSYGGANIDLNTGDKNVDRFMLNNVPKARKKTLNILSNEFKYLDFVGRDTSFTTDDKRILYNMKYEGGKKINSGIKTGTNKINAGVNRSSDISKNIANTLYNGISKTLNRPVKKVKKLSKEYEAIQKKSKSKKGGK